MNRRSFLLGLGAAAAAVTAPVKALAQLVRPVTVRPITTVEILSQFRRDVAREYIREGLFNPFQGSIGIYNGVIIRESPEQLELFPGMRTMGYELPDVTEWIDDEEDDE